MSRKVLVAIADGSEELEAVTIIDVLRRAGAGVTVASVGNLQITASRAVKIVADCVIGDCAGEEYDLIVLPGGLMGAENLAGCKELIDMLAKQRDCGRWYGAICASPAVVLERYGLLAGKKATGYPSDELAFPDREDAKVVVDGNCVTSQGPGTALEFALKLVELLYDKQMAQEIAGGMLAG